jgi:hypothetical protein
VNKLFGEMYKLRWWFMKLLDGEGVAGVEDDLVLVKGFEEVVGGFEDGFGFDFH